MINVYSIHNIIFWNVFCILGDFFASKQGMLRGCIDIFRLENSALLKK